MISQACFQQPGPLSQSLNTEHLILNTLIIIIKISTAILQPIVGISIFGTIKMLNRHQTSCCTCEYFQANLRFPSRQQASLAVCVFFCVNVCCQIAKILKNSLIDHIESNGESLAFLHFELDLNGQGQTSIFLDLHISCKR